MPGGDEKCLLDRLKGLSTHQIKDCVKGLFLLAPPLHSLESVEFCDVKEGDHLVYVIPSGMNIHFYVRANLGDGKIKVYGWFREGCNDPFIEQTLLDGNELSSHRGHLKIEERVLDEAGLDPKRINRQLHEITNITTERQRLQNYIAEKSSHNFLENNSEHFVTYVKTGNAQCQLHSKISVAALKSVITVSLLYCSEEMVAVLRVLSLILDNKLVDALISVVELFKEFCNWLGFTGSAGGRIVEATAKYRVIRSATKNATVRITKKATKDVLKKTIKPTACINGVIEGAIWVTTMTKASYDYANGSMSGEEFGQLAVTQTATSVSTFVVGTGGSAAGTAIGTAIGTTIFPGVGSLIGATVGGLVGGVGGNIGGGKLGSYTGNFINSFWRK